MAEKAPLHRCAIYVRKSSDEGLDMSYNSLEAQADACAAYIASQRHEGWTRAAKAYEDGGFSGGNLDRPGLKALLADVEAGRIDIIVVYKIDRLTRSLTDFARLNELLDKHNVSFVAVTQQFNTSTSMGRLTLNVLLSFAQFEREVSGERIRDKFTSSKRKGIWMGGIVPLGYRVENRKLLVVPEEADRVRLIYKRYLDLKSVYLVKKTLDEEGVRSRQRTTRQGTLIGGLLMSNGAIRHVLRNPIYLGLIRHGKEMHPGQHDAILDKETFDRAQAILTSRAPGETNVPKLPTTVLLKGKAFDGNGNRLRPSFCNKRGVRYYYYTSARRLKDKTGDPEGLRIPAGDLERLVTRAITERLRDSPRMHDWLQPLVPVHQLMEKLNLLSSLAMQIESDEQQRKALLASLVSKITVSKAAVKIELSPHNLAQLTSLPENPDQVPGSESLLISITSHLLRCGRQVKLIIDDQENNPSDPDPQLIAMVVKARNWFEGLKSGRYAKLEDIANAEKCDRSYVRRLLSIAFLAPDIVENILTGNHSPTLTSARLRTSCPLPMRWDEQRALLLN